jgi:hypothetical protein
MKRSAAEWWTKQAEREDTKLPRLIQRVLEEKAVRHPDGQLTDSELQAFTDAGPATVDPPRVYRDQQPRGRQPLKRDAVEPRFKKGGKK